MKGINQEGALSIHGGYNWFGSFDFFIQLNNTFLVLLYFSLICFLLAIPNEAKDLETML